MVVFLPEVRYFTACCLPLRITLKPLLPGLKELLAPLVVHIRVDPFPTANLRNALFSLQPFQSNADLLFGTVPLPRLPLDLSYD